MFTAHFSHVHIVGQKSVQNNFSKADELLLTGVKNGKKIIPWTKWTPTQYCLQSILPKSLHTLAGGWLTPPPVAQVWQCWVHWCQAQWLSDGVGHLQPQAQNTIPTLTSNQRNGSTNLCELQLHSCGRGWAHAELTWHGCVPVCEMSSFSIGPPETPLFFYVRETNPEIFFRPQPRQTNQKGLLSSAIGNSVYS